MLVCYHVNIFLTWKKLVEIAKCYHQLGDNWWGGRIRARNFLVLPPPLKSYRCLAGKPNGKRWSCLSRKRSIWSVIYRVLMPVSPKRRREKRSLRSKETPKSESSLCAFRKVRSSLNHPIIAHCLRCQNSLLGLFDLFVGGHTVQNVEPWNRLPT